MGRSSALIFGAAVVVLGAMMQAEKAFARNETGTVHGKVVIKLK